MSNLDIAERRIPQDGRMSLKLGERWVDIRVSTLPSSYGERIVLRLLDKADSSLDLKELGMTENLLRNYKTELKNNSGIILVTGPTGSGKTTTLYSGLNFLNDQTRNILTIEDPIEYAIEGVGQTQVNNRVGLTFEKGLRAILRQDPDVVMVGEIRDKETADIAIQASLTGHLVLTTLHTNDAAGAIARLDEMGVESFMVSAALLGVVAQRLMRRVCSKCRIEYKPEPEEFRRYGLVPSQEEDFTYYRANTIPVEQREDFKERGELCQKCNGIGYKGRVGAVSYTHLTLPTKA